MRDHERGAAVVDFTLILLILVPLFLAVVQVGLFLHARNTMIACASEGAREGGRFDRQPSDGAVRARQCITDALSARFAGTMWSEVTSAAGQEIVVVHARASMPSLGLWGPRWEMDISGHAVKEIL